MLQGNYCLYLRKSRADIEAEKRGDEETLARHEKVLLDLAKRNKLNIVQIYREIVSGETIAARPKVQSLLNEVEQGIYNGVLVMEIERLARGDTIDQGVVAQAFKFSNTLIITPTKTFDPSNEFDEEYFEFGLFMSRREYKTINRRIQRGRVASVQEGKFISSTAPYGYIRAKIENDKGYTLKPHPEQASVVRMIYDWYTKGELQEDGSYTRLGMTLICKKLDSLRILPVKSKKWSRATIREILSNPVYIGKIRWQWRKEIRKMVNGQRVIVREEQEEYLYVDGLHEPIIDEAIFQLAQKCRERNRKSPIKSSTVLQNPLSGLIICGKCGTYMTRLAPNTKNRYSTLKCPNRYCDNVSAPINLVENKILESLNSWLSKYKLNYKLDNEDALVDNIRLKEIALLKTTEKRDKLITQLDSAYDFLEQGVYTKEIFLERNAKLSLLIKDLNIEIDVLEKELAKERERINAKDRIIPRIENLLDIYPNLPTAQARNDFIRDAVEKVNYVKIERNTRGKINNANFEIVVFPRIPKK